MPIPTPFPSAPTADPSVAPCVPTAGDTAWLLMATVLVLGMFPGVAFFELGLLRKKNTTSILAQVFCGLPILSALWIMFGFTLTFGPDVSNAGIIGDMTYAFLAKVPYNVCYGNHTVPLPLYALFQMMFACITPLLMTGAYAERLAWKPFVFLTVFWEIIVYYPIAHWIWHPDGWLAYMGVQDFAGGIVIHTTAGASCVVICWILGKRHHYAKYHGQFPYSSLPHACVGATLLWTGWFGFNGGSALGANQTAVAAVVNSQVAASFCAALYVSITYFKTGKPSTIAMLNGVIAGLAGVTPASGYITPLSALVLGLILAISAELGNRLMHKVGLDDALEVSVVHGLTGVVGAIYIGFAGDSSIAGANGLVAGGGPKLLGVQLLGVLIATGWAAGWTFVILMVIKRFTPLRVEKLHELQGLDAAIHYETASVAGSVRSATNPTGDSFADPALAASRSGTRSSDAKRIANIHLQRVGNGSQLVHVPKNQLHVHAANNIDIAPLPTGEDSDSYSDDEVVAADIRPSEASPSYALALALERSMSASARMDSTAFTLQDGTLHLNGSADDSLSASAVGTRDSSGPGPLPRPAYRPAREPSSSTASSHKTSPTPPGAMPHASAAQQLGRPASSSTTQPKPPNQMQRAVTFDEDPQPQRPSGDDCEETALLLRNRRGGDGGGGTAQT